MSQEIKIGVNANASGAEGALGKVEGAADGAATAVGGIGEAARTTADDVGKVADEAERGAKAAAEWLRIQKILSQELKSKISLPDTAQFLTNFEEMRRGKVGGVGRAVRESAGFSDWYENKSIKFNQPRDIVEHRRRVFEGGYAMRGTEYANRHQPQAPPVPPGDEPPEVPANGGGGGGASRASSMALGFGKSILALAGIGGLIGMAGKAADQYGTEAVDHDTLKRRMGDLGVSFESLQEQTRAAGQGLGITYLESAKLALEYSKISGQMKNSSGVQTAEGLSRAFGIDPSTAVQFMATMQRIKAPGSDDNGSKRLALMIGEAVAKGGYGGKADEVMAAVSGLAEEMTRNTLAAPNLGAIAGYLTSLTKSGFPGLDPQGAAALLGQADATVRRGGGMGDASMNFSYAALSRGSPGLGVVGAQSLWQAGLFGTTRSVFGSTGNGKNKKFNSPVGAWYAANGIATPGLNDETTLSKELALMHSQYGGGAKKEYMLNAIANHFGLNNAQAAALDMMKPEDLNESGRLLGSSGFDFKKLTASGIADIGRVAATGNDRGKLNSLYNDVWSRGDLSSSDRNGLKAAMDKGDAEGIKEALVKVLGTHGQESTPGSEVRQSVTDMDNSLTAIGQQMVNILNPIRNYVAMMAEHLAPQEWKQAQQDAADKGTNFAQKAIDDRKTTLFGFGRTGAQQVNGMYENDIASLREQGGSYAAANRIAPKPTYMDAAHPAAYDAMMARYKNLHGIVAANSVQLTPEQRAAIQKAAGGDEGKASFLESILRVENRGQKAPVDKTSPKGAQGFFQFMPETFYGDGKKDKGFGTGDIHNFDDGANAAGKFYDWLNKRYKGNKTAMAAYYDGGRPQADAVMAGKAPPSSETREYLNLMHGVGGTPLPTGGTSSAILGFSGTVHLDVVDANNKPIGKAAITPWVNHPAAGAASTSFVGGQSKMS